MILLMIFLFFLVVLLVCLEEYKLLKGKSSSYLLFTVWILLALVAAFRPSIMPDYQNYKNSYLGLTVERLEIGFYWISELLKKLHVGFYAYLLLFALFSIGLKVLVIRKMTKLVWLSILVYVSNFFILHDLIQMRAAIASGFLLWALYYRQHRDLPRFLTVSVMAFLFHYSAIIILPLWFLSVDKSRKWVYIGLIFFSYFIVRYISLINLIIPYLPIQGVQNLWLSYEIMQGNEINIYNVVHLCEVLICVYLFLFSERIYAKNKYALLLMKTYAIGLSTFVLLSDLPVAAFRVSELYRIVEIVLFPMLVYSFCGLKAFKYVVVMALALFFLLMNIYVNQYFYGGKL